MDPEVYERSLEGYSLHVMRRGHQMKCDLCSAPIVEGEPISIYFANIDYTEDPIRQETVFPSRVYCDECTTSRIRYPTTRAREIVMEGTTKVEDNEWIFRDVEVVDFSGHKDGIDWDPERVWGLVFDFPLRRMLYEDPHDNFTPEDVVSQLEIVNRAPWEILDHTGSLNVPKSKAEIEPEEALSAFNEQFG